MPDELDLTLPKREPKRKQSFPLVGIVLVVVLAVGVANLVLALRGGGRREGKAPPLSGLAPEEQKELALKLEREGLRGAAVRGWQAYLEHAELSDPQRANVWYRIGKLHQDAGRHEEALEAFYTSEGLAHVDDIAPEIARRTRECLEAMGKFAALRHALADRVQLGDVKPGEEVVAEIGPEKITRARLDQMVEAQIERQLTQFAAFLPPEERKRQKEALVKRLGTAEARLQMLEQFVAEEILYRKAREAGLAEEPETRALLADLEKKLLAQRAMDKELADQINITPGDLQTYYQAHLGDYVQPERAKISLILVKDDDAAQAALKSLSDGMKFEELAKQLSLDEGTKDKGGEVAGWVDKGSYVPGIGTSDEATAAIFATEAGQVAEKTVKTDRGVFLIQVREREPERQKAFEEVRPEVYRALRAQKTREVQHQLLAELRGRYDVVIHRSKLLPEQPDEGDEPKGSGKKDDAAPTK